MARGKKFGLYLNSDLMERLEALQGQRILIRRTDVRGEPFMDEERVPQDASTAMRKGLALFLDLAERQATIDMREHPPSSKGE